MRFFQKRALNIFFLSVCCVLLSFAACGTEEGNVTEEPTEGPTPTPKSWVTQLLEEGRTELSREYDYPYEDAEVFRHPVSVSKTVQLGFGDFEFTMTVPKAIFRLSDLKNGVDVFEVTLIFKYIGEKESIWIACGDLPFSSVLIHDPAGNTDGGGSYDVQMNVNMKKDEEIRYTLVYDEFAKKVDSTGTGVIMATVSFRVLDENQKELWDLDIIWDEGRYLLAIPFDVVE